MRRAIPLLLLVSSIPVLAQTPYLVKDINTTYSKSTKSSAPAEFAALGSRVFFAATTDGAGRELWSTDGTSNGTSMVADIIPGTGSSNPSGLTVVNGVLLFAAPDVDHGVELWTSDGTAAGTRLFLDINPGPSSSQPVPGIVYNNRMLFSADDGTNGRELWITDGTAAGTHMLKDIASGPGSSAPSDFVAMGGSIYFSTGGGLWKTNGTASGTVRVAIVTARKLAVAGSRLFFEGSTTSTGWELWVSNGSEAGTHMVTEIFPGARGPFDDQHDPGLTPLGDRVLFLASDGVHGREMWTSDGTAAGTRMVRDFIPGAQGMWDGLNAWITTLGDRAYFVAHDAEHGFELWVTDGTDAGTQLFADLTPGPEGSNPSTLTVSGGKLFFAAGSTALWGPRLWVSDGTVAGTHSIGEAADPGLGLGYNNPNPIVLWPVDEKIYFIGWTALNGGEPWVSDGTDGGSRLIANIAADGPPSSTPFALKAAGKLVFFFAVDGDLTTLGQSSLWRSDGTAAGTFKLFDAGQYDTLTPAGPLVFFNQGLNGEGPMVSDGTVEGTGPADNFLSRFGPSRVWTLFPFGDTLFATVNDLDIVDLSLWKTTAAPNAPAVHLGTRNPGGLIEVAGRYFFYAQASRYYEYGLWTTDGTREGTYAVVPTLGDDDEPPSRIVNAGGTLFFIYKRHGENRKLWKSDGTFDGTVVVKELPAVTFNELDIKAAGRRVFVLNGDSLWTSDGTESGTIELTKVSLSSSNVPDNFTPVGNRVLFVQHDGTELWSSDGTAEGTKLLLKVGGGTQLRSIDGLAYFANVDSEHGRELWATDGTVEGTKLFADVNPGPASSSPFDITKAGDRLYFEAYNDATGAELWALPLTEPVVSINDTRVAEGDAGTTAARFNVTLAQASKQPVTVDYATSDGTARAGEDYDATSGTLTFAPGETAKTIDVRVRGDVSPENNETFFVTLRNASGARLARTEAAGIIDDDDQTADLEVEPRFDYDLGSLHDGVSVSNHGPRGATDVSVRLTSTPFAFFGEECFTCSIPQIPAGGFALAGRQSTTLPDQVYLSATATGRQRDPQPLNNAVAWTINRYRSMAMSPAFLTPGGTATVTALTATQTPVLASSDPSVVSVPTAVTKVGQDIGTFTITALSPGTSTIAVDQQQLLVTVVAAGTTPRWPGGVAMWSEFTNTRFDKPININIRLSGTAPVSAATATGTIVVTAGGQEPTRRIITGPGDITFALYLPSLGSIAYTMAYSGDANFLPQTTSGTVFVYKGAATIAGVLEPVAGAAGSFSLKVATTGSPVAAPTGTLSIVNGTTEIATLSLVSSGGETSFAETTLANLPLSPTLTINYSGDAFYEPGSQQVRSGADAPPPGSPLSLTMKRLSFPCTDNSLRSSA